MYKEFQKYPNNFATPKAIRDFYFPDNWAA